MGKLKDETLNKDQNNKYIEPSDKDLISVPLKSGNLLANLPAPTPDGFKSLSHYASIELYYAGIYKIDKVYVVKN